MSIFVPEKLRDIINTWIQNSNKSLEHGGVFFGTETEFKSFLPIPNFSNSPTNTYNMGNAKYYVSEFGKMIGQKPIAGMHTHPNGSIPSEPGHPSQRRFRAASSRCKARRLTRKC